METAATQQVEIFKVKNGFELSLSAVKPQPKQPL